MYEMTLDFPNLADGAEVDIDGLGRFENGSTYEIGNEQAETFRLMGATRTVSYDEKGKPVYEEVQGPTLLQAFAKNDSVEVTVIKPEGGDK